MGRRGCPYWEHTLLTTTYWVAPQMGQIVMLRSKTDILTLDAVHHIRQYMEKKSDQFLVAPIITFRGEQVLTMDRLANHKSGDTFILFEEVVPPEYASHAGRLYECSVCSKSFTCKKNVSKGCKKGRPHRMLFGEILGKEKVKTWGSNLDRYTVPYGCPPGHKGTGGLTIKREAQGTQQSVQQDALPGGSRARGPIPTETSIPRTPTRGPSRKHPGTSSTPSNPSTPSPLKTPRGERRFRANLEHFLSPESVKVGGERGEAPRAAPRAATAIIPPSPRASRGEAPTAAETITPACKYDVCKYAIMQVCKYDSM